MGIDHQSANRSFVGAAPFAPNAPASHRGGLYRRSLGEDSWDELRQGLPEQPHVRAVAVHPDDPDVVFAGTQDGPYRSADGGDSWERLDFPSPGLPVWSFAFHPSDPMVMYLGAAPAAVYRSEDGGEHWRHLPGATLENRVEMGFPTRLVSIVVDPARPDELFAGVEVGGVMYSKDGGDTWADRTPGLVALAEAPHRRSRIGSDTEIEGMLDVHSLALAPGAPGVVFLALRMGLFCSDDGGVTWQDMEVGEHSPLTYCRDVQASPHAAERLYACLSHAALSDAGTLYRSDDLGATWQRCEGGSAQSTLMRVASSPRATGQIWCASRQGEVFASADDGRTWQMSHLPEGGRDVYALACT